MKKKGLNSVMRCNEQFTRLSKSSTIPGPSVDPIISMLAEKKNQLGIAYYVAVILYRGNARISEVLGLRLYDIISPTEVFLHGSKGSRDKVVSCPECYDHLVKCISNHIDPIFSINRRTVWGNFKRSNLYIQVPGNSNLSVTHMFRHLRSDQIRAMGLTDESVRDVLGHNSINSANHYGNSRKKRK